MKRRAPGWLDGAPDFFLAGDGRNPHIPHPGSPPPRRLGRHLHLTLQRPTLPISPHIDEDALEGVYFAF